jgi:hypothetical protein
MRSFSGIFSAGPEFFWNSSAAVSYIFGKIRKIRILQIQEPEFEDGGFAPAVDQGEKPGHPLAPPCLGEALRRGALIILSQVNNRLEISPSHLT